MSESDQPLRGLVADVAAAYFSSSHVSAADIPNIIALIATSLGGVGQSNAPAEADAPAAAAAHLTRGQVRKSITPDALISFEDGKSYKTLRRHLSVKGLTPETYREKWGLPSDYPMVAPSYSAARSALAKSLGLGQKGHEGRRKVAPKGRGRAKAAEPAS